MARQRNLRERIVDAALELGEARSWESVRLYDVAATLNITLDDIRAHFREKEDVAEAWFDRADAAMLADAATPAFQNLAPRERLHRAIMTWLDALTRHKRVTREIIFGKLEPGHLHVQIPGLLRISRTVQWFREAAHRDATFLQRALEETGVTTMYVVTFFYWMQDDSENAARTREFLQRLLGGAETLSRWVYDKGSSTGPSTRANA
ncbi:MAG: TetR/AcrR family transcriptional regulator [Acidiferrobacterales bacterium]